ncbi:MAG TPA: hypothetical protein VJT67_13110, partial [Longimicrobiaceae bacterium]|nr:hypothetical protein [Longimicrobiaceae bacterium]
VRNLLLNWLVLLPVLAAAVAVPQLCLLLVQAEPGATPPAWLWVPLGLATGLVADLAAFWIRTARLSEVSAAGTAAPARHWPVVAVTLGPLWVSSVVTVTAAVWAAATPQGQAAAAGVALPYALIWLFFNPLLAWAVAGFRFAPGSDPWRPFWPELVALVVSGGMAALLLTRGMELVLPWLTRHPAVFVATAVPVVLAIHLLAKTLFVGIASLGDRGGHAPTPPAPGSAGLADMDREWWARLSGWVLIAAVTWGATSLLVLAAAPLVTMVAGGVVRWVAAAGGTSGVVVTVLGMSGRTASGRRDDGSGSKAQELALRVAVPIFCAAVIILLALGMVELGRAVTADARLLHIPRDFRGQLGAVPAQSIGGFAALAAGVFAIGAAMAWAVNVNRFSLQALYRNRLVRAYLGASNPARRPDPFTGFDPRDDFPLAECRGERPLPFINATLNLVRGAERLAWQQRKAESFSMSPLYCGNFHDGYRRSAEYAGGLRLGSAVAVSGAAANPNMGYHSSPAVTFLLTLFNARLGAWLGNPGIAGRHTFRYPGPVWALRPILSELFGHTDSRSRYVNLSDGGHFENLGLYEMVLRRCRFVVVSDAGQDPNATFDDLGNAIRKIRIDFRISIEFDERIHIAPRQDLPTGLFCARARIRYRDVDGPDAPDGLLLYVKPALYGRGR